MFLKSLLHRHLHIHADVNIALILYRNNISSVNYTSFEYITVSVIKGWVACSNCIITIMRFFKIPKKHMPWLHLKET